MALNAYLTLKGSRTGEIKGSVIQKGREGKIQVIAADHDVASPRDQATGQAIGQRQHHPFRLTKEVDKSSPLLYRLFAMNETIAKWELQFWRPNTVGTGGGSGVEVQHYTVRLTGAVLSRITFRMLNNKNPELVRYAEFEELEFTYARIEWIWNDGGIASSDDWGASGRRGASVRSLRRTPRRA